MQFRFLGYGLHFEVWRASQPVHYYPLECLLLSHTEVTIQHRTGSQGRTQFVCVCVVVVVVMVEGGEGEGEERSKLRSDRIPSGSSVSAADTRCCICSFSC